MSYQFSSLTFTELVRFVMRKSKKQPKEISFLIIRMESKGEFSLDQMYSFLRIFYLCVFFGLFRVQGLYITWYVISVNYYSTVEGELGD